MSDLPTDAVPSDSRWHWIVTFLRGSGRDTTFHRWEVEEAIAVESAKEGFQECYGYWPNEPIIVKRGEALEPKEQQ